VEQLGAGSGAEGVEALSDTTFELIGSHDGRLRRRTVGPRVGHARSELTARPSDAYYHQLRRSIQFVKDLSDRVLSAVPRRRTAASRGSAQ
jgi:hypothetical protein